VRVAIADDAVLVREGIARLLLEHGFDVVGQAADASELDRIIGRTRPDVAIVDLRMPPTHTDEGIRAAADIRTRYPGTGVLVLSQYLDPRYAIRLLEESPAGVGYLLKERVSDIHELAVAIRRIANGESVVDRSVVSELVA
jgi:DNA-binding NarL/FixJ family response regulator